MAENLRMGFRLARVYPIIDLDVSPDVEAALGLLDVAVRCRVPFVQLRAKTAASRDILEMARTFVGRTRDAGTRVIVNDRVDIAVLSGAAGVHLGQDDLAITEARRIAGRVRLIIGLSTHSLPEARRAASEGADYIGFGPMYETSSKTDALAPRSLDELRAVREAVAVPVVAIGGIDESRAVSILAAGADSVAMIRAFAASPDPAALITRLSTTGA